MPNNFTLGWALVIAAALTIGGGCIGWQVNGWRMQSTIDQLKADHASEKEQQSKDLVDANGRVQTANDDARNALDEFARKRIEEKANDQAEIEKLGAAIRAGTVRLSIATASARRAASECSSSATVTAVEETRADIDPRVGIALISITDRGDEAIKDLNLCIDSYNAVRDRFKQLNAH